MSKPLNLQLGWPSRDLFPAHAIHDASTATLLNPEKAADALIYGPDPGYQPLRESTAKWLTDFYAPKTGSISPENIFVANGASMALSVILSKFTDPLYTKQIFMVEPAYFLACPIFEDAGFAGRLRGVPEDDEGIDTAYLREQFKRFNHRNGNVTHEEQLSKGREAFKKSTDKYPKLYRFVVYAVPTFSNPSGKVMSLRRRRELVELAREHDALVVTDDVYDMLRWPVDPNTPLDDLPPPPPRLIDIDREVPGQQNPFGNTCSNGSFSKIVAPGFRVSWVDASPAFTAALSTAGAVKSGGSPGHMASVFADHMLRSGQLARHIRDTLNTTYRARWTAMNRAVEDFLTPLGITVDTGAPYTYQHDPNTHTTTTTTTTTTSSGGIEIAGGFFTYLLLPSDLQPAEKIAVTVLKSYDLKVAHGNMMTVAGDFGSAKRAVRSFGRGIRLSWSWHDEREIREGVERLARLLRDVRSGNVVEERSGDHQQQAQVLSFV